MILNYPLYKIFLAIFDFIFISIHFIVINYYWIGIDLNYFSINNFIELLILPIFWMFIFQWNDLYKRKVIYSKARQVSLIEKSTFYGIFSLFILKIFFEPFFIFLKSNLFVLIYVATLFLFFSLYRIIIISILFNYRTLGKVIKEKSIIVGSGNRAKVLAANIINDQKVFSSIIGFVDDNSIKGERIFKKIKNIGHSNEIISIVKNHKINTIYIAIDNSDNEEIIDLIELCSKTNVNINIDSRIFPILEEKVSTDNINEITIISNSNRSSWYVAEFKFLFLKFSLKRVVDIVFAITLFIILIPLLVILALGVKLSSKGEIIFVQKAVGLNGNKFNFYKFRSMKIGSEKDPIRKEQMVNFIKGSNINKDSTKIVNEKLITVFGRFLRKYSLDELPQIFNIIKGDMSFVGPRPAGLYEFKAYTNWHKKRLEVTPGITGLWQVSARSETNFNDMVILDYYYIQNLSPWLDLQIFLKTIPAVIFAKGAK